MWPDGGKVFAFFTVPTPSAVWAMQRDIPYMREQQLIGVGHGLLRHKRYHGEWIDAPLLEILRAMQQVHVPSEGRFYVEIVASSRASGFVARRGCFDVLGASVTIRAERR